MNLRLRMAAIGLRAIRSSVQELYLILTSTAYVLGDVKAFLKYATEEWAYWDDLCKKKTGSVVMREEKYISYDLEEALIKMSKRAQCTELTNLKCHVIACIYMRGNTRKMANDGSKLSITFVIFLSQVTCRTLLSNTLNHCSTALYWPTKAIYDPSDQLRTTIIPSSSDSVATIGEYNIAL